MGRTLSLRAAISSVLIPLPMAALAFLSSCSGTGGASYDGEVYLGAPSSGPTVQQIMELADSGDVEAIVNLFTVSNAAASAGGGGGSDQSSEISFTASDIGLPSGGSVTLTMTVDGESSTYTATAGSDGNVTFSIPAVPTGSDVSVRIDVRDSGGTLMLTGRTSKTVTADDSSLAVTLSDKVNITPSPSFSCLSYAYIVKKDGLVVERLGGSQTYRATLGTTVSLSGLALMADGSIVKIGCPAFTAEDDASPDFTIDSSAGTLDKNWPDLHITDNASDNRITYTLDFSGSFSDLTTEWSHLADEGLMTFEPTAFKISFTNTGFEYSATTTHEDPSDPESNICGNCGTYKASSANLDKLRMLTTVTIDGMSVQWNTYKAPS